MLFSQKTCLSKRLATMFFIVLGLVFFPLEAFAWGPIAHIDFSIQILAGISALAPAINRLVFRHSADFFYGSLAADTVIGKNFASEMSHCHSWAVAQKLLYDAKQRGERFEAFMLGYFSHLGADVIAHNHFVPERLVAHYRSKGIGHLYWEARFDQKLLNENPEVRNTWDRASKLRFPEHDQFLAERLEPTLFSHQLSARIYRHSLGLQRRPPWQSALTRIDARSKLPLSSKDIARWRMMSVSMAVRALNDPSSKELYQLDPVGRSALDSAVSHRQILRRRYRSRSKNVRMNLFLDRNRTAFGSTYPPRYR